VQEVLRFRVAVVGDATVGKTALVSMFESGGSVYPKEYAMSVGMSARVRAVRLPGRPVLVELYLLDAGGQAIFNQGEFGTTLWNTCDAVVVVFDVSSSESFTSCSKWLRRFADTRPGRELVGVLVANKVDLEAEGRRVVSADEAREYASTIQFSYAEVSAVREALHCGLILDGCLPCSY
jgi:transport family protein 27